MGEEWDAVIEEPINGGFFKEVVVISGSEELVEGEERHR